jgi:ferredoxin--NADP+ reductase
VKIIAKKILADCAGTRLVQLEVAALEISRKALAGQFVVLMAAEKGERIPLTVAGCDPQAGTLTLILQEAGLTTRILGRLNPGDALYSLVGPLGHPAEIPAGKRVILVGGGVGIAEVLPVAQAMQKAGNYVISILGARSKELLILEDELKACSNQLHIATDDGSYGRKGFVTDILQEVFAIHHPSSAIHHVYAVGPIPMMRGVAQVTRGFGVKTIVSLNALMVDGTGMCGCCRVTVAGRTQFSCVDGPDFDAHQVDWGELSKRSKIYADKEKHICRLTSFNTGY